MRNSEFAPISRYDGYPPIEDHGLIGDGCTAALVSRDGSVPWLCVPRFGAMPLFCELLDHRRGGAFHVTPEDVTESRQYYWDDCPILVTEMRCRTGLLEIHDTFPLREGADLNDDTRVTCQELHLYDSLCERAGAVGLLPEQIDPASGDFLGNYLQAFSHIGVISSGINLVRLMDSRTPVRYE